MQFPRDLPNLITVARLVVTAACLVLLELGPADAAVRPTDPGSTLLRVAGVLFLFAAATDWLDGWLARRFDCVSRFGRIADPLVDKVLILGTLIVCLRFDAARPFLPAWTVAVLVAREIAVTTIRGVAEGEGHQFPADRLGKWKMVLQTVLTTALLARLAIPTTSSWIDPTLAPLLWATVALTIWSGAGYVVRAASLGKNAL